MNTEAPEPLERKHTATQGSPDTEYQSGIAYIHHMHDTRHKILQFVVGINTALLAVVFEFVTSHTAKAILSLIGGLITVALALMATRSLKYLATMEDYVIELEAKLNFGLIRETRLRMPEGRDSNDYLLFVYWALAMTWLVLLAYYLVAM